VSDSNGPVRRRRIAGESKPAAPVAKAARKAPTLKKPVARKTAPARRETPATKAPAAKAPVAKAPATNAADAKKVPGATPTVTTRRPVSAKPVAARPAVSTEPSDTRGRPSRRDLLLLVPLALVALAVLVIGGYLVVNPPGGSSDKDVATAQRQASSAAASAAETIFSFQYDKLDEHLSASKALMTPSFAKDFDKIAPALTELAPQRKIQVQAMTRESAALPCGDECSSTKVSVLVFIDQARLVGSSKADPTVFANRIKVSMVKRDGGWLVNQIDAI
jgi:Mce-associated membrane protein